MKIKNFITASLGFYIFSAITIVILGLVILPKNESDGVKLSKDATINTKKVASNSDEATKVSQADPSAQSSAPTQIENPNSATQKSTTQPTTSTTNNQTSTGSNTSTPTTTKPPTSGTGTNTGGGTTPPPTPTTPPPTPTPPPPTSVKKCGEAGGACTASEIAAHNTASDCWVIFNKNGSSKTSTLSNGYYIITPYTTNSFGSKHPSGGSKPGVKVFNSDTCGQDFSAYFYGGKATAGYQQDHTGFNSAISILKSFYVGPVK